jgi:hypothetical protein
MVQRKRVVLSAQELEALIGGGNDERRIDPYFPLRTLFIALLSGAAAIGLIMAPQEIAASLFSTPELVDRYAGIFYLRGMLMLVLLAIAWYSYTYGKYTGIVFFAVAVIASSNLVTDILEVYPARFSNPAWEFTAVLLLRLIAWLFTILNVLRCSELPEIGDRWNFRLLRARITSD